MIIPFSQASASQTSETQLSCAHCGEPVDARSPVRETEASPLFCCAGCQTVYAILNQQGLGRYYEIKNLCVPIRKAGPASVPGRDYAHLDNPEFLLQYTGSARPDTFDFFLEGVHCVACLWLIEKLPSFVEGVTAAELDLGKSVARLKLTSDASLGRIAAEIEKLGYRPHPVRKDEDAEQLMNRENRGWLVKIGIAAAGTMNIMLMTVPLYAGADGPLGELFRWTSGIIFLPVLFWSGLPFMRSAWAALRRRELNIDVPIVAAVLAGAGASAWNLCTGSPHIYFDSLSALIFLLLSSRYFLRRLQQSSLSATHLAGFLTPSSARRWNAATSTLETVPTSTLKPGDFVEVARGELLPADGTLVSIAGTERDAYISSALLTGEPYPRALRPGTAVFSGTRNEGESIRIAVTASGATTRLGAILKGVEEGRLQRANIVNAADRTSRWFLGAVFVGAAVVVLLSPDLAEGFNRALALLIVTCPCALALATPLALSIWLTRAAATGLLIKNGDTIERLANVKTVLLDKTGTLTEGSFTLLEWTDLDRRPGIREAVHALEARSRHPIAHALCRWLGSEGVEPSNGLTNFAEILGRGVSGVVNGTEFEVRGASSPETANDRTVRAARTETRIEVVANGTVVARIRLGDRVRADSATACARIREMGIGTQIVSGDAAATVEEVGFELGFKPNQVSSGMLPEQKRDLVARTPSALMVGDGANDAIALSSAFTSAAVHGAMDISLRTADSYLVSPGVMPVANLLETGRETFRVIRRNFVFSIFYNVAGATAVLFGWVNPLFAAVLMPASALTVFVSSTWGTKRLRKLCNGAARHPDSVVTL